MAYFRVRVQGDADRAAGLLALAGIQNIYESRPGGSHEVVARLSAETAEQAVERVAGALDGESFVIADEAQPESQSDPP